MLLLRGVLLLKLEASVTAGQARGFLGGEVELSSSGRNDPKLILLKARRM